MPQGAFYPRRVRHGDPAPLKPGRWNRKLGGVVRRGPLKGARIFTLTLEERATCPDSCQLRRGACYGRNMPFAWRHAVSPALLAAIHRQLARLTARGKVLVRLHVLGDFPSVAYVQFWRAELAVYPNLYLFGYTHWRPETPIGAAIQELNRHPRAAIKVSVDPRDPPVAGARRGIAYVYRADAPPPARRCLEETGERETCADCGLCLAGAASVGFQLR